MQKLLEKILSMQPHAQWNVEFRSVLMTFTDLKPNDFLLESTWPVLVDFLFGFDDDFVVFLIINIF